MSGGSLSPLGPGGVPGEPGGGEAGGPSELGAGPGWWRRCRLVMPGIGSRACPAGFLGLLGWVLAPSDLYCSSEASPAEESEGVATPYREFAMPALG